LARRSMLAVLVGLLWLPWSPAGAVVTCTQDEFGQPFITLASDGDRVDVRVGSGGAIQFDGGPGFVPCGTATRNSTDTITITDTSGGNTLARIDLSGGPFEPGSSGEPGGSDEIEFHVDLGGQPDDVLLVSGTSGHDLVVVGHKGVNLNPTETKGIDADIQAPFHAGVLQIDAGDGNDEIRGDGGFGTGEAFGGSWHARGEGGNDVIRGSEVARGCPGRQKFECLDGNGGRDRINGRGGRDELWGGQGNDELQGGRGDDLLRGHESGDTLAGGRGRDTLRGDTGNDRLFGEVGKDALNGGADNDRCLGGRGSDDFRNCEALA
jgi:Ca2+-binding RTX toxin-like protein